MYLKMTVLLVFPLDMDAAHDFISVARALGSTIVGASSAMPDAAGRDVDHFESLPFVTDCDFPDRLATLVGRHSITHIYAPHHAVWWQLKKLNRIDPARFGYTVCEPDPFTLEWRNFAASYDWADAMLADTMAEAIAPRPDLVVRPRLARSLYAGLHLLFTRTPGQCDDHKLHALAAVARLAPRGDVVEIGSLYGRSAVALAWLAREHDIGGALSIDPWRLSALTDQGEQAALLNEEMPSIDLEKIFLVFRAFAAAQPNLAYIRDTSASAREIYATCVEEGCIDIDDARKMVLTGVISILHIDGNHRYDQVKNDIALWTGLVKPGGWVLVDDYVWSFGDGPQRAGDELLASGLFDCAFAAADTLFLRRGDAPARSAQTMDEDMESIRSFVIGLIEAKAKLPTGIEVDTFNFIDSGHVDSIGIIKFVLDIESHYDIDITESDMISLAFRTVGGLVTMIEYKLAGGAHGYIGPGTEITD